MNNTIAPDMDGAQKVAALLLSIVSIDRELVSRILDKFEPDELSTVANAATHLGTIPPAKAAQNIEAFLQRLQEGPALIGNSAQGQLLVQTAADRQAQGDKSNKDETIWQRCGRLPEGTLESMISREVPDVITFWLSNLAPGVTSKVLTSFESDLAAHVMTNMAQMSTPRPEAMAFMERYVSNLLDAGVKSAVAGDTALIPIISNLDETQQDRLMSRIEIENPALASNLRKNLFKFSDIETLDLPKRIVLFEKVRTEDLVLALNAVNTGLQESCLQALGGRMRRMVEQELSAQIDPPTSEVAKARQAIVSVAIKLIREGIISR